MTRAATGHSSVPHAATRSAARLSLLGCLFAALLGARPQPAGATEVVRAERVFVDASRPTRENGGFPGAPERTLRTLIWHQQGGDGSDPYPLLLMAHGFGGLPEKFDALARFIAARGYVVASPAFPLTNQNAPGGHLTALGDVVEQPADLSFVYARLLAAAESADDELAGLIDPSATAVLGHSLGGLTVEALVHSDCCGHIPFRAAILASTVQLIGLFGGEPIDTGPPTLVLHGTDDPLVPFASAFDLLAALPNVRALVGIHGGSHSALLESQVEPPIRARDATERTIVAFLDAILRGEEEALRDLLGELAAAGEVVVRPGCPGDCDGDGTVEIGELVTGVTIATAAAPMTACTAFDRNRSGSVTIDELLLGVRAALTESCATL